MAKRTLLFVSAVLAIPSMSAAIWHALIGIYTDRASPMSRDIVDLKVLRSFPVTGYISIDQSISIHGHEIDVWALIQDQHTRGLGFLDVLRLDGARFDDVGPLAAGTYDMNVEIWLTPWPSTSGGELIDAETLQLTIVPEPQPPYCYSW